MYAEIAINAPVHQTFHYHVPPDLQPVIKPGHLVEVPFATAQQHGIVVDLHLETDIPQTKDITGLIHPEPLLTFQQIDLGLWMADRYLAPVGYCLWLMLPPGITNGRDIRLTLLDPAADSDDPVERKLLALIRKRDGVITGHQIDGAKSMHGIPWDSTVRRLVKDGILLQERILRPPRTRAQIVQTAALAIHPNMIPSIIPTLGRDSRRADLLMLLAALPDEPRPTVDGLLRACDLAGRSPLEAMEDAGLVIIDRNSRPHTVSLAIPRDQVETQLITLRKAEKHLHILQVLAREPGTIDVSWLYAQTNCKLPDLQHLEELGYVLLGERPHWRDSLAERDFVLTTPPTLTPEQAAVWEQIAQNPGKTFLLHGVTGSGKTEIYLRAMEAVIARGQQAILLVPEIALTAQTIRRVGARLTGRLAVIHSQLTEGERYDTWRRAREGLIDVVIGARSALFAPLPNLGLIILDEEHDQSYKNGETPYYHARDVAEERLKDTAGTLLLGSATPALETIYRTEAGEITHLQLPSRIIGHRQHIYQQAAKVGVEAEYNRSVLPDALTMDLPPVQVVDMRDELKAGNTSIFSTALQTALAEVLKREQQAILFLNRRGAATYVFCRDCGYVASCPNCDTPLTFHRQGEALRCHRCGHTTPEPKRCPQCGSGRIKFFGAGTQQVEAAMNTLFPQARTLRWDADTATTAEMHEYFLQRFIDRKADILIGTQMIAKGLDLPLVTLVGVVSADMALNLPDFRAGEHTFQTLTQVAGRAGRGLLGGRVILQTYQPEHYAIQFAARHDMEGFYAHEMAFRQQLGYPPYRRLVRVVIRAEQETRAESEAIAATDLLRARLSKLGLAATEIIGPAPCFFRRVNNVYRWHLLLRGPDPTAVLRGFDPPRGWSVEVDPLDVL
ncbi:MAG TPA: primosomal protein N' [Aggregatilineales bacterium]|nr:primosomal protein N' [Aggregatilineales bacterium]